MLNHESTGQQAERWLQKTLSTEYMPRETKNTMLYLLKLYHEGFYGSLQTGFQRGLPNTLKESGRETLTIDRIQERLRSV